MLLLCIAVLHHPLCVLYLGLAIMVMLPTKLARPDSYVPLLTVLYHSEQSIRKLNGVGFWHVAQTCPVWHLQCYAGGSLSKPNNVSRACFMTSRHFLLHALRTENLPRTVKWSVVLTKAEINQARTNCCKRLDLLQISKVRQWLYQCFCIETSAQVPNWNQNLRIKCRACVSHTRGALVCCKKLIQNSNNNVQWRSPSALSAYCGGKCKN